MAKHRPFSCSFWTDPDFENMKPIPKLLYIFFFTNPFTTESGIYQLSIKKIHEMTGISIEEIENSKADLIGKIAFDGSFVFVVAFIKSNYRGNPLLLEKSILNDCKTFRSESLWNLFLKTYPSLSVVSRIKDLIKSFKRLNKVIYEAEAEAEAEEGDARGVYEEPPSEEEKKAIIADCLEKIGAPRITTKEAA